MSDNANVTKQGNGQDVAKSAEKDTKQALIPPVDVIEDAAGITLLADLPGVSKDRLNLRLETNRLTIEGEMALDLPEKMESRFVEVDTPRYQRSFTLSKDLDSDKATAELKNGVLRLHIPKAAHLQPRRIQISAA